MATKTLMFCASTLILVMAAWTNAALATPPEQGGGAVTIFNSKCASCHGQTGAGDTAIGKSLQIPDLRSPEAQKLSDAQITQLINKGKTPMPAFRGNLTPAQIQSLVAYVRTLGKKKQ